jgi:CHAT domain-containing protein/tetratricopeptide (TPR) repeat protein
MKARRLNRSTLLWLLLLGVGVFAHSQQLTAAKTAASLLRKGLVIESVSKSSMGERLGIHSGDVLLSWDRVGNKREFESPFDLAYVFLEQAPRGPITITAARGHERLKWILGSDTWGISVRPNFDEPLLSIYSQAEQLFQTGNAEGAIDRFRAAAALASTKDLPWLPAWLLSHAGKLLTVQRLDLSDALYDEAIRNAAEAGPLVRTELRRQRAAASAGHQDLLSAAKYYRDVLLESRNLGSETLIESSALVSLGVIELKHGDYDAAEEHLSRAMSIGEANAPSSIQTILTIVNLAVLYQDEGQLKKAEQYYFKALEKEERGFPNSPHLEGTLNDLAVLFDQQGDLARAEAYHRRALAIAQHVNPASLDVADILANLAECVLEQGNTKRADFYAKRALAIRENLSGESLATAHSFAVLGKIARIRGDLTNAEEHYRRSLMISGSVDNPPGDQAEFFIGLAAVLRQGANFSGAEQVYRQALKIIEERNPRSIDLAALLGDLAGVVYRQGRFDEAEEIYRQTLDTLDKRSSELGGVQETRSRFRAEYIEYYKEYIRLLIEQQQPELAYEVLEGVRARTLLEMLRNAHLDVNENADPVLRQRELSLRRSLNAQTAFRLRLAEQPHTNQQLTGIDKQIEDLLLQYQQVQIQLRVEEPSYAALAESQELGLAEIQRLLDPNTLLLEYSLAEDGSYVWLVSNESLQVFALPKRGEIEAVAHRVYSLLAHRNRGSNQHALDEASAQRQYDRLAKKLSEMVLGPMAQLLRGKRLVIVADGVLQFIPFAALPAPGGSAVPLVANNEIVNLPSASVLVELRRQEAARAKATKTVAIFADPVFDATDERLGRGIGERAVATSAFVKSDLRRATQDRGLTRGGSPYLSRLLYTRNEATAVMAVAPAGKAMLALDFEANRRTATSAALATYRVIHFATHGILNNQHPELSGLVLSLVDRNGKPQDGFLNLQDIYNLKLPVELVVLSGCQTGLGEQINGEGLIGLTRGFMYAGASRVVASLWSVSDIATAKLMARFYRAMERDRMRPAAALRAAQVQMWKEGQWSSPYYWAAFQIAGDWR